jgi:pimeloyl-ACP methyl ester carboxylesterase
MITASLQDQALIRPAQYALEMLNQLQDGRVFISQKGGHPLLWGAPEDFRRGISGFLERFEDPNS